MCFIFDSNAALLASAEECSSKIPHQIKVCGSAQFETCGICSGNCLLGNPSVRFSFSGKIKAINTNNSEDIECSSQEYNE